MTNVEHLRRTVETMIPPLAKRLGIAVRGDAQHVLLIHPTEDAYYTRISEPDDFGRYMRTLFPVAMLEDCAVDKLLELVERRLSDALRELAAT